MPPTSGQTLKNPNGILGFQPCTLALCVVELSLLINLYDQSRADLVPAPNRKDFP